VRLPDRLLRLMLGVVLTASGVKLLSLPYSSQSAVTVLATGLLGVACYYRFARRRRLNAGTPVVVPTFDG
jgi:hypothetical protein